MSELSQETRALIDNVSRLDDPSGEDRARVRQRLAMQLGMSAFAAVAVTGAGSGAVQTISSAASKTGLFGAAGKAALCAGALCAAGSIWLLQGPPQVATDGSVDKAAVAKGVHAAPTDATEPVKAVPTEPYVEALAETPATAEAAPLARTAPRPRLKAKSAVSEPAVVEAQASTLKEELMLLGRAQAALRAGRPADALSYAREHEAQFPEGRMREERLGVVALAECSLGHEGRAHAEAFLKAAPDSPLAARVRKSCGLE